MASSWSAAGTIFTIRLTCQYQNISEYHFRPEKKLKIKCVLCKLVLASCWTLFKQNLIIKRQKNTQLVIQSRVLRTLAFTWKKKKIPCFHKFTVSDALKFRRNRAQHLWHHSTLRLISAFHIISCSDKSPLALPCLFEYKERRFQKLNVPDCWQIPFWNEKSSNAASPR